MKLPVIKTKFLTGEKASVYIPKGREVHRVVNGLSNMVLLGVRGFSSLKSVTLNIPTAEAEHNNRHYSSK